MTDLEYRIGQLRINLATMEFDGIDSYDAKHKFVVQAKDKTASIYIAEECMHLRVAMNCGLIEDPIGDNDIVGGGSCYTNKDNELVLDNRSGDYKAIPKDVAQKFGELVKPELEKLGMKISGVVADPDEWNMNPYWNDPTSVPKKEESFKIRNYRG